MNLFIIFLIIFLLFVPIPLKIYILYKNSNLIIRFYKYNIYPLKNVPKTYSESKESNKPNTNFKKIFDKSTVQDIFNKLSKNHLKPKLKLDFNLDYGFEDAALTGISYGILNLIFVPLQHILYSVFKVKKLHFNTLPDFNDSKLNLEIKSIISVNIVQIINMSFLIGLTIFKSCKKHKYIHKLNRKFKEA